MTKPHIRSDLADGMAIELSLEALVRDLGNQIAGLKATVEGVETRVNDTRQDAREARDAAQKLTAQFNAQDMPAQLEKMRGEVQAGFVAARSDLVNASTKTANDIDKVDKRIDGVDTRVKVLEGFHERNVGVGGFVDWFGRHAPWIIAAVMTLISIFGVKVKIP